jgi:hypothetical protein
MDTHELATTLDSLGLDGLDAHDPSAALARVELAAADRPRDRALVRAALALAERLAADLAPPVIAGVRRRALIRWDAWTTTWTGTDLQTGEEVQIRALRPGALKDPVLRRWLEREARALRAVLPVRALDGALVTAVPGQPALEPRDDHPSAVRGLATALADLARWEGAGLGIPSPAAEELRQVGDSWVLVGLTLADDVSQAIAGVCRRITGAAPVARAARGMAEWPPRSTAEAAETLGRAMADTLAAQRHELASRWLRGQHGFRTARLLAAVERLRAAVPPPTGRGAVGVDLDGQITVVRGEAGVIAWGPIDAPEIVYAPGSGVDAPLARRLLRARAASPPNRVLDQRVGGDPEFTEAACRWVSSELRLRTVRLLLEKAG